MIRDAFTKILKEYKSASKQPLKNHPLANYIRNDVPKIFHSSAGHLLNNYNFNTVKHAGKWSAIPWFNIMDERATKTAKEGYYPVYLFHENGKKILFELGQGRDDIEKKYGKKEGVSILKSRAIIMREKIPEYKNYGFKEVTMKMKIGDDSKRKDWVLSGAFGKMYDLAELPDETTFVRDLDNMLKLYNLLIERGGVSENIPSYNPADEEIINSLKGTEKKALRVHLAKEDTYIKTDTKLIKNLKEKNNYTCQACNLKTNKIYRNGSVVHQYVEAHHVVPKEEILKKTKLGESLSREESDFAILCANCHRMIHKFGCPSLEEFKKYIKIDYIKSLKDLDY